MGYQLPGLTAFGRSASWSVHACAYRQLSAVYLQLPLAQKLQVRCFTECRRAGRGVLKGIITSCFENVTTLRSLDARNVHDLLLNLDDGT